MNDTTQLVRELPADVYDALELSAEAFGGVGRGRYVDEGRISWQEYAKRLNIIRADEVPA